MLVCSDGIVGEVVRGVCTGIGVGSLLVHVVQSPSLGLVLGFGLDLLQSWLAVNIMLMSDVYEKGAILDVSIVTRCKGCKASIVANKDYRVNWIVVTNGMGDQQGVSLCVWRSRIKFGARQSQRSEVCLCALSRSTGSNVV